MKKFNLTEGNKVQSYDKDGYYIMPMCGTVVEVFHNGDAIIKSVDGYFYSSISFGKRVSDIEFLN